MPVLEKEKKGRRYAGASHADRRTERRARLVLAAIQVFGRAGREGATVAAICAEAGLTARYFYESFPNREALYLEAYREVQRELLAELARWADPGDPVRGALTGFYAALAQHPGLARVFLLDPHGRDPEMQAAGQDTARRLVLLFAPKTTAPLVAAGLLGAVIDIARRWIEAGFAEPVAEVVAAALPFVRAAGPGKEV
ncbi:MAG: TetR/AcrR family transcriptional regulator [Rhizomicrobium sp.]